MGTSFRLGRIAGIELGLNWSALVLIALLVWTLSTGIFPATNPGLSSGAHFAMAVAATVLFLCSLLLHELGHALQARREGIEIEGITLWLFGGVAKFNGMFPSAGAEFRVAVAGPLVSLLLGVVFVVIAIVHGLPGTADGVASWLGYINLTLLVFNLLPALPLDGGRVLRSALWRLKGDFAAATRTAAAVGRGFGFLFIAGGIALLIFQGSFSGAWLAFTGWFLLEAATAEAGYALARQALDGLLVRDVMTPAPATVAPKMTIGELMDDVVWQERHSAYPVVDDGKAVGLLPLRRLAEVPRGRWDERHVDDCMLGRDDVPVLRPDEPAADALTRLTETGSSRALVASNGRLVGILSLTDLMQAIDARPPQQARARTRDMRRVAV
jgi:Zn-dependent protease/predicted transcriptional regulator